MTVLGVDWGLIVPCTPMHACPASGDDPERALPQGSLRAAEYSGLGLDFLWTIFDFDFYLGSGGPALRDIAAVVVGS